MVLINIKLVNELETNSLLQQHVTKTFEDIILPHHAMQKLSINLRLTSSSKIFNMMPHATLFIFSFPHSTTYSSPLTHISKCNILTRTSSISKRVQLSKEERELAVIFFKMSKNDKMVHRLFHDKLIMLSQHPIFTIIGKNIFAFFRDSNVSDLHF